MGRIKKALVFILLVWFVCVNVNAQAPSISERPFDTVTRICAIDGSGSPISQSGTITFHRNNQGNIVRVSISNLATGYRNSYEVHNVKRFRDGTLQISLNRNRTFRVVVTPQHVMFANFDGGTTHNTIIESVIYSLGKPTQLAQIAAGNMHEVARQEEERRRREIEAERRRREEQERRLAEERRLEEQRRQEATDRIAALEDRFGQNAGTGLDTEAERRRREEQERRLAQERRLEEQRRQEATDRIAALEDRFGQNAGTGLDTGDVSQGNPVRRGVSDERSWSLDGRSIVGSLVRPVHDRNVQGVITVNIRVDETGQVVDATIGTPTSIEDAATRQAAIDAAHRTRFSTGRTSTTGTITYNFRLM